MPLFFIVLLSIMAFIIFIGLLVSLGIPWMSEWGEGLHMRNRIMLNAASILLLAVFFTIVVPLMGGNGSEHCGPGTRYVSETHYNPATKSTVTEWMCVAD